MREIRPHGVVQTKAEKRSRLSSYFHNAIGALVKTIDAGGHITDISHDVRGAKIFMKAPNTGSREYEHNAFGELIWQKDARGQTVDIKHDALGRITERMEAEGTTVWIYDKAERGIGKIYEVKGPEGYLERYGYDELGRLSSAATSADGKTGVVLTAWDDLGRIDFQVWPGDFSLYRRYNSRGYLTALQSPKKDNVDGFNKEELENRMRQALEAATEAQRLAWQNRVAKLRYEKKAEIYRRIAVLLNKQSALVKGLRQTSKTLSELGGKLGEEAEANEAQAAESREQAQELGRNLAETGGSEAELYQTRLYHRQMADMLADMAEAVMTYNDDYLLTGDHVKLASHCVFQAWYHRKKAVHYQHKGGEESVNGLDHVQMMADDGGRWITYWRAGDRDAAGRLTSEVNGNGLYTEKTYNPAGQITQILSRFGFQDPVRNLTYQHGPTGNMKKRQDIIQETEEDFVYDALDRLKTVKTQGLGNGDSDAAEEEESRGDVKQLSFSGSWSRSGGRNPDSPANPSFSFNLKARSMVTIDLDSRNWVDTYLYLKNSSGRVIARNDDGGWWLFSKISMALEKGDYTIVAATYRSGSRGAFSIRLDSQKPPAIATGQWNRSGGRNAYDPANPVFSIAVSEKSVVQIDLTSRQDTYLYLLNADRRIIARNDDGGYWLNSRLRLTLNPGQYYVVAATYWRRRSGDFQILLSGPARFGGINQKTGQWTGSGEP